MSSKLYLIPSFLGTEKANEVFPELNREIVRKINYFIVEEIRTARRFLKKFVPDIVIDELHFIVLNEHSNPEDVKKILIQNDISLVGLISEAGVPCVADPGSEIVQYAHEQGIEVIPLIGPSSILLALMGSGLNGQNFAFNGYLPVQHDKRIKMIKFYENRSYNENQTQVFIETPYRNMQLLKDILIACEANTLLCIACHLTLPSQLIKTASINEWKIKMPDINKHPAIFVLKRN